MSSKVLEKIEFPLGSAAYSRLSLTEYLIQGDR